MLLVVNAYKESFQCGNNIRNLSFRSSFFNRVVSIKGHEQETTQSRVIISCHYCGKSGYEYSRATPGIVPVRPTASDGIICGFSALHMICRVAKYFSVVYIPTRILVLTVNPHNIWEISCVPYH